MITAALEDIPRAQFSYNFDYEHQIVQRLQSGNTMSTNAVSSPGRLFPQDICA